MLPAVMISLKLTLVAALAGLHPARAQNLIFDSGRSGPSLEVVHLYNDQWPTGNVTKSRTLAHDAHILE